MFKGSIVALITPFKDNVFDEDKYIALIHHQIKNGTKAVVPAGTTGESPTLNNDEHKKVIDNNAGLALAKLAGQLWDGFEVPARKLALDAGGTIHSLSGGPLAEMKAAGEGLEKDWIKSANDRGLDGAMLVKTAKDLISKYDK